MHVVVRLVACLLPATAAVAMDVPLAPRGPGQSVRFHAAGLMTDDELNHDDHGSTDSRDGWRVGVHFAWTAPHPERMPVGFLWGIDLGYERREMVGVLDRSIPDDPFIYEPDPVPLFDYSQNPEFWAWYYGSYRPSLKPRRQRCHLNVVDVALPLGVQVRFGPGNCLRFEGRVHGGVGAGTLGGDDYLGWCAGATAGFAWVPVRGLRLGVDVGYAWRGGRTDSTDSDASYLGRALSVGTSIGTSF